MDSLLNSSSSSSASSKSSTFFLLFFSLGVITVIAVFSCASNSNPNLGSSPKLARPVVILISLDAFHFGYQHKTSLPNINRLIANGTEAHPGLIPVFPTLTFPSHYSIATGLYPSYHGIINNHFVDPNSGAIFSMDSRDPSWWLGEPIWETVAGNGYRAATYFWPGSEVKKGCWTCPDTFCFHYNKTRPFEDRVDTVLGYFDLPMDQIPVLITMYFEEPDLTGHEVGPDDPELTEAVARMDGVLGRLIQGLEGRGVFDDVNIILLGDHGMVGICKKKYVFLDDLAPWVKIEASWVHSYSPLFAMQPPPEVSASEVVKKMNEGLSSGEVENGKYLKVFLKEDLPERLHYSESYRIPAIVGLVEEGYKVEQNRFSGVRDCGGDHGYDNTFFSMRTIFVGHGPRFAKGRKVPSFVNVEVYNLITSILKLEGAPNNGSALFSESILVPTN